MILPSRQALAMSAAFLIAFGSAGGPVSGVAQTTSAAVDVQAVGPKVGDRVLDFSLPDRAGTLEGHFIVDSVDGAELPP